MRITELKDLDGVSLKDTKRMPSAWLLCQWDGLYTIDVALSVFRVVRP